MAASDIFIAVDGGASGTRARVTDGAGRALGVGEGGPGSLTLGIEQAWTGIRSAIAAALGEAGLPGDAAAARHVFALAGSRHPRNIAAFHAANPLGTPVTVMTDGYASLIGALAGEPGSVVAVGTGVAGHRLFADGTSIAVDGWGFPAGDEGSGAWIGLEAARLHLRAVDGRGPGDGVLAAALANRLGREVGAIQDWLVGAPSTKYATLAPLVVDAAAAGDPMASDILDRAGEGLDRAVAGLDRDEPAPALGLIGGLAGSLSGRLSEANRRRLVPARGTALDGAVLVMTGAAPEERIR
ncbi:MAG: BadF/BadG/BcrA/BcrD ATPase family protein [Azospirillaceae bacterium]